MVICLERGADLHMAQLMPLPFIPVIFYLPSEIEVYLPAASVTFSFRVGLDLLMSI